jgi:hypothetical protein
MPPCTKVNQNPTPTTRQPTKNNPKTKHNKPHNPRSGKKQETTTTQRTKNKIIVGNKTVLKTPSPNSTDSPNESEITIPTPHPTGAGTSFLPTEIALVAAVAVAVLIAVLGLAFKKGYVSVEVVNEEGSGQEENQDE